MGALAPLSHWIPQDDLLLKNAVETGASLESLAKGAVPFSQRFTVRELQDRWYSLLYDPGVSTSASACMIEYERSASNLPSKFNRFGISKENKSANAKRKAESIRTCYYALRKRNCSEPFESMDLSFLVAPSNNNYVGNGDEPLSGTCVLGDPISHSFGLEGSKMDSMHHTFAENLMHDGDAAIHFFNSVTVNPDEGFPYDPNNVQDEMPHIFEDNLPLMGNGSEVEELGHQNRLQECSLFKTDDAFGQINNNQQNISSEFEEKKVFSSPISECGGSFNNVDFSSPLPGLSIWRTVSAPELPVDLSAQENNISAIGTFELPEDYDAKNTGTSGYDIQSDVKVKNELSFDDFRIDTSTEGYFAELSNSLLNFSNEEELMCIDGKDTIDESYYDGLSSLLLSSPNDNSHDQMINLVEQETSVAPDMCIANSSVPCLREPEVNQGSKGDEERTCNLENPMQSSGSASDFQFSELKDGVICCTLNTEDSEVPYNDDVFLTDNLPQALMSSVTEQRVWEANNQGTLFRNSSINKKTNDIGTSLMHKKQKSPRELYLSYQIIQSHVSQEMDLNCGVKIKHSATDSPHLASSLAAIAVANPDEMSTVQVSTKASLPEMLHGESKPSQHLNSNDYSVKKSAFESEGHKNYPPVSSGIKEEHGVSEVTRDHQASCAQTSMEIAVSETVLQPQSPEWEADLIESDHEVPCYSDIEAMVLDMDLDPDPDDRDLFSCEEVSRYQLEETKRAVIRLEQGTHSYMQRAIASHGAFAILYGRHSKHYIKKLEVLIGRATDSIAVDIDLGREGHTNKVSRRQAIIRLEECGSIYLKNLGKCFISVNNKEVGSGQSISLSPNCLIEIRGLAFIFETNQTCVKQYLDNITIINQRQ